MRLILLCLGLLSGARGQVMAAPYGPGQGHGHGHGQGQGYAPQKSSNDYGLVALILALISWAMFPVVAAIVSLVFCWMDRKERLKSPGSGGGGMALAAAMISGLNLLCFGGFLLIFFLLFGFSMFSVILTFLAAAV